jgi:hypothetical protein
MDQPDPTQAVSREDLAWCLRHLRTLADTPTYRELERRTIHTEGVLPGTDLRRIPLKRATIADVLAGNAFPRKAFLLTFAEACGVDIQDDRRWEQAWNRLAVSYQAQPAPGEQAHEDLGPANQHAGPNEPVWERSRTESDVPQQTPEEVVHPALYTTRAGAASTSNKEIQPKVLTGLLEAADAASGCASPLLGRLAWREVERVTAFMRQVHTGQEITYDGEDREWLLGLMEGTQHSIDAISLSTVDATPRGFDGGLWASDLGVRYLELQREAIERGAAIRRIFVFDNENLTHDEVFLRVTQMQRDAGVNVRILDFRLVPELLLGVIFDFVIFDDEVSYEVMTGASFNSDYYRPINIRTMLVTTPARIQALKKRFEQLWAAADPERTI